MLLESAITFAGLAWACPSIDAALEVATVSLVEGGDATAGLSDAASSLACMNASQAQVGRVWLVRGASAWFAGRKEEALPLLAAARALVPDGYDARLGAELKDAWAAALPGPPGNLIVDRNAHIDGTAVVAFPVATAAGPHAIQIVDSQWARTVFVQPGEDLRVETGLPVEMDAPNGARRKRSPALLIAAGGAALAAGACAGVAFVQNDAMTAASAKGDLDGLNGAHTAQLATGVGAYGLAGLAAAGVVLHFVLP